MSNNCLIGALAPLKESSRLAIADAVCETFSDEKKYLHIERPVESELKNIIKNNSSSEQGVLILVCGNVGDGKSHLISALRQENPQYFEPFSGHIYNDATESSSPTRNNIDELKSILAPFSDANISESRQKAILAVNLGTLSNFIIADKGNEYNQLTDFVKRNQILEIGSISEESEMTTENHFQYVSLCDHNLFHLTEKGPTSKLIEEAIEKIAPNASYDNIFRETYEKCCLHCSTNCPIRLNYELLSLPEVRDRISSLLIQTIVKHHHIISIRSLYSFIYDLIVPVVLDGMNNESIGQWVNNNPNYSKTYIKALIPNYLFEHPEISKIFEHLHYLDPSLKRNAEVDEQVISLVTSENPSKIIGKCEVPQLLKDAFIQHATNSNHSEHDSIVKTYIRLTSLITVESKQISFEDKCYAEYMKLLYGWFRSDRESIKKLYKLVLRAVMLWNGNTSNGEMLIESGNRQLKYRLSEKVYLNPGELPVFTNIDGDVFKFTNSIKLQFYAGESKRELILNLDCRLYDMLRRVENGYRINQIDRRNFIAFSSFVTDVMRSGELRTKLRITESETRQQYILARDEFGDFVFNNCERAR